MEAGNAYGRYLININQEWLFLEKMSFVEFQINPSAGECVGYTVKTMEKDFCISNYPLEQTDFLYDSKQGMVGFFLDFFG